MAESTKWQGHRGPVSCLDTFDDDHPLLLSGSEDKTARLWDLRDDTTTTTSRRQACLCVSAPGEIFSVKFAPHKEEPPQDLQLPINPFAKDHTIYVSMEHVVLEYDLRHARGPILSSPSRDLSEVLQNQDEVNQIAAMYYTKPKPKTTKGGGGGKGSSQRRRGGSEESLLYVAAADDDGTIRFMESTSTQSQILHHDPNGVAVVPCCAFRPGSSKTLDLVSGGTDCKIHLWDPFKPKRPVSSYTITHTESADTAKPQVCNPPMVHSMAWSPSGTLLAAGLGDGNIPIFSIENRNLVLAARLLDGHMSSVAFVMFPTFAKGNERLVISGGSDGSILGWDVGTNLMELATMKNPNELFHDDEFITTPGGPSIVDGLTYQTEELSLGNPRILFSIPHGSKVNWMTTSGNSIFVADTSHDITEYKLPLR